MTTISSTSFNNAWGYVKRAAKIYPDVVFGTGGDVISETLRDSFYGIKGANGKRVGGKHFKDFWQQLKDAFKAGEVHNEKLIKDSGGFWKAQWESIRTTPKVIQEGFEAGGKAAEAAGKSKLWGQTKGIFKGLGKRLPIIGSLMIAITELPNIFRATKDEGIVSGAAEVVKAGARLGGSMLFATIGGALGGPIGMLVGGFVGDWLVGKIVGKTYSEKVAEKGEKAKQYIDSNQNIPNFNGYPQEYKQTASYIPPKPYMSPEQLMSLQQALSSGAGLSGNNFNMYA